MKKTIRLLAGAIAAGVSMLLAIIICVEHVLPDSLTISPGEPFYIGGRLSLQIPSGGKDFLPKVADASGNLYNLKFDLDGSGGVREVISQSERRMVSPGGIPFGIKMYTEGLIVVGMSDIQIGVENVNPAKKAGIKIGDVLTHIDDKKLERCGDVKDIISKSQGDPLKISLRRGKEKLELELEPVRSELDDGFKAGIWVRDSSAGIGTMTYYDPESKSFAGLGHAVCDVDTGAIMPLSTGEIMDVNISGVNAGQSGKPGELKGSFIGERPMGRLLLNSESGLFGRLYGDFNGNDPIPMASKRDVKPGPATMLSTISGNKPQSFDIMIERVNYSDITPTKNIVITVTDQRLLATAGGIVQGMSGSPIIQNGALVGAVTHVFVNDPTKGYGIFAENMEKQIKLVETGKIAA